MSNDNLFSSEYIKATETASVSKSGPVSAAKKDTYVKIDEQYYGLAKPKRIRIKGSIVDGQSRT